MSGAGAKRKRRDMRGGRSSNPACTVLVRDRTGAHPDYGAADRSRRASSARRRTRDKLRFMKTSVRLSIAISALALTLTTPTLVAQTPPAPMVRIEGLRQISPHVYIIP